MTHPAPPFLSLPTPPGQLSLVERLLLAWLTPIIERMFARLHARLADLFARWRAGTLPPPPGPRPAPPAARSTPGLHRPPSPRRAASPRARRDSVQPRLAQAQTTPARLHQPAGPHPPPVPRTLPTPTSRKNGPQGLPSRHAPFVTLS